MAPPSTPVRRDPTATLALSVVGLLVLAEGWVWVAGELAWQLSAGRWIPTPASLVATLSLPRHMDDPALAWVGAVDSGRRGLHPGPVTFYACAAAVLVVAGLSAWAVGRARRSIAPQARSHRGGGAGSLVGSGSVLRRGHDHETARWASSGDLRGMRVRKRVRRGLVLGRIASWPHRLIATEARHSVLVLGPTQSGKTSGLAIPAILEWNGPVVATSVKDDLARCTLGWRETVGPAWVFDPTASSGLRPLAGWSPLALCSDWSGAQRTAGWLVDATPARSGMADAAFWYSAAAKQLSPLLLAAQRADLSLADVVRWNNAENYREPAEILQLAGESDALLALSACEARDERIRSSVTTTLETVLAPFEDPVVAAWTASCDVDLESLLQSKGTLYLCGPSHEQQRVQGLFAALVSAVVAAAVERTAARRGPLDPPLLLVLDEAANIAPIRELDVLASIGAGLGVELVTVCQDLSQLSSRYGQDRARTIVNNHRAKLLLSGVSDLATLDLLSGLAGEQAVREESYAIDQTDGRRTRTSAIAFRRLAPSDQLRRIAPGRAVLVYGHLPPVHVLLRPWFSDRALRGRAAVESGGRALAG